MRELETSNHALKIQNKSRTIFSFPYCNLSFFLNFKHITYLRNIRINHWFIRDLSLKDMDVVVIPN